ncbi:hypothetical protein [uncultured Treponema sp.]|nr:hypothetical protein [uncultured Treponema sp.]
MNKFKRLFVATSPTLVFGIFGLCLCGCNLGIEKKQGFLEVTLKGSLAA